MKTYTITKKRAGEHKAKEIYDFSANSLAEAKKEFKSRMISDLYMAFYDEKNNIYKDEQGMEIWGFSNDGMRFSEDVFTWELIENL